MDYNKIMNKQPITHTVTIKPDQTYLDKQYTLEEALESGYPIYTRAKGLTTDVDKGFPHISEAIGVDGMIDGGNYIRFSNPCFIYNYLHQSIHNIKPGKRIPL